jgi:hypothetical protein
MKKNNPNTPIMLREAAGTQPRVYARYGEFTAIWTLGRFSVLAGLWTGIDTNIGSQSSERRRASR